ncbi:hypothetical protein AVEN_193918-1 [Araneus ventricosus]|uniref:Uncharacterized protein n=1 Tax=Araneus ventricosus TaxID=182803 RepID=A0A4Y2KWJ9_ARAVE|nr:hypothetical protein AVEN_193918-1 [Araneus ventricosus]
MRVDLEYRHSKLPVAGKRSRAFFYYKEVVHMEFLLLGCTVTKEEHFKVFNHRHDSVKSKRPDFWNRVGTITIMLPLIGPSWYQITVETLHSATFTTN